MTADEARVQASEFVDRLRSERPRLVPPEWVDVKAEIEREDCWLVVYAFDSGGCAWGSVVVPKSGGQPYITLGALGRVGTAYGLGLPISDERWLGSVPGRYQRFAKGLAVWDRGEHRDEDIGYARFPEKPGRCSAIIGFTDIRGFTRWAERNPDKVQSVIADMEDVFQKVFAEKWCSWLYVKSTGDGLMIVSEAESYLTADVRTQDAVVGVDHALAFVRACGVLVLDSADRLRPHGLKIGCGVDAGDVDRVNLLGQRDYLGPAINEAFKAQSDAENQLVVSVRVDALLGKSSRTLHRTTLASDRVVLRLPI